MSMRAPIFSAAVLLCSCAPGALDVSSIAPQFTLEVDGLGTATARLRSADGDHELVPLGEDDELWVILGEDDPLPMAPVQNDEDQWIYVADELDVSSRIEVVFVFRRGSEDLSSTASIPAAFTLASPTEGQACSLTEALVVEWAVDEAEHPETEWAAWLWSDTCLSSALALSAVSPLTTSFFVEDAATLPCDYGLTLEASVEAAVDPSFAVGEDWWASGLVAKQVARVEFLVTD